MARKDRPPLPEYMPKPVRGHLEALRRDLGDLPVLTHEEGTRRWHIELEGKRLRLTMTWIYKVSSTRYHYSSTLSVDGCERDLAQDYWHFIDLWKRYEEGEGIPELEPLPESADPQEMPLVIRKVHEKIVELRGGRPDIEVTFAIWQEEDAWIIGVNSAPKNTLVRIKFVPMMATWVPDTIRAVEDGQERSGDAGADFMKMLMSLLGGGSATPPSGAGPVSGGSSTTPGKANSVLVRRHSVIRN